MQGFTDKPAEKIGNDIFGLERYISGLSSFILECNTPMTIAIQGDWGSGKTSMMNMIKENLGEKTVPVWFNTWQFSQFNMGDQLALSLMSNLIESFDVRNEKSEGIKKKLNLLASMAKNVAIVATDTFVGGKMADAVEGTMERLSGNQNNTNLAKEISNIKEQFQDCVNSSLTEHQKERIVIFVDDLDRLQPSKAVELLEVLKLFLDCDHCVFVLAIDYEVVSQGVKEKFGTLIGDEKGRSFFDKIIQVPFKMPVAQYDVFRYVTEMLFNIGIDCSEEEAGVYVSIIQSSIGCNPRSMKRLFNAYLLLTKVANQEILDSEWKKKVLFGVLCLQLSFEKVYNYIASNRKSISDSFLFALADKEQFESYQDVDLLKKEFSFESEDETAKLIRFMKNFNKIIDKDGNNEFSEKEIEDFADVLGFSTITSATKDLEIEDDGDRWNYRRQNRKIVKNINSKLKRVHKTEFSVYQSNKDYSDGWKFYYASGYKWFWKNGKPFNVEFVVKTDLNTKKSGIGITIGPRKQTTFDELFMILDQSELEKNLAFARTEYGLQKEYPLIHDNEKQFEDVIYKEVSAVLLALQGYYDS